MFQHQNGSQRLLQGSPGNGQAWLAMLIDEMEQAGQPDLRPIPCDAAIVAAFTVHLAHPPLPLVNRGPQGWLLN